MNSPVSTGGGTTKIGNETSQWKEITVASGSAKNGTAFAAHGTTAKNLMLEGGLEGFLTNARIHQPSNVALAVAQRPNKMPLMC